MTDETKKKIEFDIFITNAVYPDALSIFTFRLKSLEEIKDDCYIVLDTNVLLTPYTVHKGNLLEQCRDIYSRLIVEKRLIVPGQVAREFAENRTAKLSELHQKFSKKKQVALIHDGNYPLLSNLKEYELVAHLEQEIDRKLKEYKTAVGKVLTHIEQWTWNDPVSLLYSELFTESVVVDPPIDKEEMKRDLDRRQLHKIPPGYKDASKDDQGIGDLLIWNAILEIGRTRKKSVIFVSNDGKPDWFKQSEKSALYLRYELIDEFRRQSDGQSFHVVRFSSFLELYGANERVVEEIKKEETILNTQTENANIILWKERLRDTLRVIDSELSKFLRLGGMNFNNFQLEISQFYSFILYSSIDAPSDIDESINQSIKNIESHLDEIVKKEIFIDGGKTMNELFDLVRRLQILIRNLLLLLN